MDDVSLYELTSSSSSTPADCLFGIELTMTIGVYNVPGRQQAWRMRIIVSRYYNVDPNLFLYRRNEPDISIGNVGDTFEAVCSPCDLDEYPAGAPTAGEEPPFYRLAEVDLISRNRTLLDQTWDLIKEDRNELIRTLVGICEMENGEVSAAGYFPTTPTPTPPTPPSPSSSTSPGVCPVDAYTSLAVIESDDTSDFPVGSVLVEVPSQGSYPTCARTWRVSGLITGHVLELVTSMTNHTFTATLDSVAVDAGGMADDYAGYVNYTTGVGEEHTLRIAGVLGSSTP